MDGLSRWVVVLLFSGGLVGCQATGSASAEDDVDAIGGLYASWRQAVAAADIPAYVKVLHPDVRLLPPGAPPIVGADNYAGFLKPVFATADYRIEVVRAPQIEVLGDTAVAEYEYIIHLKLKNPDVGVSEPGALTAERTGARYFDVLRRNASGQWSVWRHTWQGVDL